MKGIRFLKKPKTSLLYLQPPRFVIRIATAQQDPKIGVLRQELIDQLKTALTRQDDIGEDQIELAVFSLEDLQRFLGAASDNNLIAVFTKYIDRKLTNGLLILHQEDALTISPEGLCQWPQEKQP